MRLNFWLIVGVCALTFTACGHAPIPPDTISMRLRGGPANATVTIDDIFVGSFDVVQARGVALPIGSHRVSIEAPGYLPWDQIVEATREAHAPIKLEVRLRPIPD